MTETSIRITKIEIDEKEMFTIYYKKDGIEYKQIHAAPVISANRIEYDDSYFYEIYFEVVRLKSNEPQEQKQ